MKSHESRRRASGRWLRRLTTIYCLGDPNLSVRIRSLHLRRAVRDGRWRTLADIGCGIAGPLGWGGGLATNPFLLAKYHPGALVAGADIDRQVVDRNRVLLRQFPVPNLRFLWLDLLEPIGLPPQDVVIMADVVGNRPEDEKLVRAGASLLGSGGCLVLHVPTRHPSERPPVPGDRADFDAQGYSEVELRTLLEACGASDVRLRRSFGMAGRLAGQMHFAFRNSMGASGIVVFPIEMCLALLDTFSPNLDGHGMVAVAHMGKGSDPT